MDEKKKHKCCKTVLAAVKKSERIQATNSLMDKPQKARNAAEALDKLTEYKAILARAFRGELGTNDPAVESAVELVRRALDE